MRLHRIRNRQTLPIDLGEAWDFFATPANLPAITPDWLGFTLTSELPPKMYEGLATTYSIRPFAGLRVQWLTVITAIREPDFFADEQRVGPYQTWHHQHLFRSVEGGTEAEDIVHYALPFDPLSRPLHDLLIRPQLQRIFEYRYRSLADRFGAMPGQSNEPPPGALVFSTV